MKERFSFDGQLHIPPLRIEETASLAIERGLDALIFTNYGDTLNFDYLARNRDNEGNHILTPNQWEIQQRSPTTLELLTERGNIYIVKGEEPKTKQGHVLVWGAREAVGNGLDIEESLRRTYDLGGVPVFSHLLTTSFSGCGRWVFEGVHKRFQGYPLGVEQNGQIPLRWMRHNEEVRKLAEEHDIPCFGTSDIHGKYKEEHRKIGLRLYSTVPYKYVDPTNMPESFREIMLHHLDEIEVEGTTNTLTETVLWNLDAIRMKGWRKVGELIMGVLRSIKK